MVEWTSLLSEEDINQIEKNIIPQKYEDINEYNNQPPININPIHHQHQQQQPPQQSQHNNINSNYNVIDNYSQQQYGDVNSQNISDIDKKNYFDIELVKP